MNRLKELRQSKKKTQQEMADIVGVTKRTYIYWEQGERQIKPEKAKVLADYFGVTVGYLLGYEDIEDLVTETEDILKKGVEEQQKARRQAIFEVLSTLKEGTKENKLEQKETLELIDTLDYLVNSLDKWNKKLYESQTMLLQYEKLKQKIDYSKQELKNLK